MRRPAIQASGISVQYDQHCALQNVSFEIPEGSFVSIIGPNGSGKSTLLNALLGMEQLSQGTVALFGEDPRQIKPEDIGYLPQLKTVDRTFPALALELVVSGLRNAWPWRIGGEERVAALEAMQRTGVGELAARSVGTLSGGELQRVYLARALIRKPRLLLLDEPGAGMDVTGEAEMYHLLEAYRAESNATIMMVTHDWEGARAHASHVMLIKGGLAGFGAPEEWASEKRLLALFGHSGHVGATHGTPGDA